MKVQIAFDLAANGVGDWFTLDDPVKGVLGGTATTHPLSGEVLFDITDDVRAVSVKRGRSRTLEKFTAGVASVVIDNRTRNYDPTNAASPYFGMILPRKEFRVDVDGSYLFVGNVEDWNFGYTLGGDSTAEAACVDGLAYLANQNLSAGATTSQTTGARIETILDTVGWPAARRAISTGAATLDSDVRTEDVNALAYLQRVELSEPGAFFVSRDGVATFLDRTDLQNAADSGAVFGGTGVPFIDVAVVYGTEEMVNSASVTWSAGSAVGGTAVANDTASHALYGVMDASYDTLLASTTDAQLLADWIVAQSSSGQYRFDSLTVRLDGLTAAQKATVLGLDLGSIASVDWTPNAIGSAISQYVTIDGIEHKATPRVHDVTFTLSSTQAAFILDNAQFGQLDDDHLGF